ncbi:MAG: A/G-specific adenine glycosylase [Candidatus Acidiferrales bacterium]
MKITPATLTEFRRKLLRWYRANRRDMPWRGSRDPYRIWVAEVMLQQTRIAAVLPYYRNFLRRFPTVRSLASARPAEVLRAWAGLGYYSRARNSHQAAKEIVARHGGNFPRSQDAALTLPGIGRYTAAAVLSIAYDVPLAALDGNVARVLARLAALRGDLRSPRRWRQLESGAQRLLAQDSAGDWNQALMELGETLCTPRNPRCGVCPVARFCLARSRGLVNQIPAPRRKRAPVQMRIAAAVLLDPCGRTLLVRDPGAHDGVLFSRMWQFPAVEVTAAPERELKKHLAATLGIETNGFAALREARHGVTFRNIVLLPFLARVKRLPRGARSRILPIHGLAQIPVSSATRKIAQAALESV